MYVKLKDTKRTRSFFVQNDVFDIVFVGNFVIGLSVRIKSGVMLVRKYYINAVNVAFAWSFKWRDGQNKLAEALVKFQFLHHSWDPFPLSESICTKVNATSPFL